MINIKFLQCFQIPRFWTRCFFKKKLGIVGRLCLSVLRVTKLASVKEVEIKLDDESSVAIVECNNLTIINLVTEQILCVSTFSAQTVKICQVIVFCFIDFCVLKITENLHWLSLLIYTFRMPIVCSYIKTKTKKTKINKNLSVFVTLAFVLTPGSEILNLLQNSPSGKPKHVFQFSV